MFEREGIIDHVRANAADFRRRMESFRDLAIVGDVRGDGYFLALELVKDPDDHSVRFTPEERERLMRGLVAPRCSNPVSSATPTTGLTRSCSSHPC